MTENNFNLRVFIKEYFNKRLNDSDCCASSLIRFCGKPPRFGLLCMVHRVLFSKLITWLISHLNFPVNFQRDTKVYYKTTTNGGEEVGGGRWESGERVQARSTLTSTAPKARSRSGEVATLDEVPRISLRVSRRMWFLRFYYAKVN